MKKFTKKFVVALVAVVSAVCMSVSLAACGGEPQAELVGSYGSGSFTFMSAYPGFTFKQVSSITQTLNTYDDNTYVLTVTTKNLSGDLSFDASNSGNTDTSETNDRGQIVMTYYGTYTSSEEEGMLSVVISKPTRVTYLGTGNLQGTVGYADTDVWTDDMGEKFKGYGDTESITAEQYLANNAFSETTIVVDLSTYGFSFATLTVAQ